MGDEQVRADACTSRPFYRQNHALHETMSKSRDRTRYAPGEAHLVNFYNMRYSLVDRLQVTIRDYDLWIPKRFPNGDQSKRSQTERYALRTAISMTLSTLGFSPVISQSIQTSGPSSTSRTVFAAKLLVKRTVGAACSRLNEARSFGEIEFSNIVNQYCAIVASSRTRDMFGV